MSEIAKVVDTLRELQTIQIDSPEIRFWWALEKSVQFLQETLERDKGCDRCGDKVIVLRKVDCENCTESQGGIMCGKLKQCPDDEDFYYDCVCEDDNDFCPMCGKKLERR